MELKYKRIDQNLHDIAVRIIEQITGHNPIDKTRKVNNFHSRIIYSKLMALIGYSSNSIAEKVNRDGSAIRVLLGKSSNYLRNDSALAYKYSVCMRDFLLESDVKEYLNTLDERNSEKKDFHTSYTLSVELERISENMTTLADENKRLNQMYDKYSRGFIILDEVFRQTTKGTERATALKIKRFLNG